MSLDRLRNCPRCDELFVYSTRDICPQCIKKVEREFEMCAQFLRNKENRSSSITEMSEKTGVTVYQITEFIREKRLMIDHAPNLGYTCEGCSAMIRTGRLCSDCTNKWKKAVDELDPKKGEEEVDKPKSGYFISQNKSRNLF